MLRTFNAGQKQVQNFEFEHTFLYKIDGKKTDRKDCVGDKYAFSCGNNDVNAPPHCAEQSTEHLWS